MWLGDGGRMSEVDWGRGADAGGSRRGDSGRSCRDEMADLAIVGIMRGRCVGWLVVGIAALGRTSSCVVIDFERCVGYAREIQPRHKQACEQSQGLM